RSHVTVSRPVELEPPRRVATGGSDVLHTVRRHRRQDDRQTQRRRGASHRQLALFVHDALDTDRRERNRRRERRTEHRRRQVTAGHVSEEPGDDAPTVEGGAVGAGGALRAGASRDVAEGLGRKALAREVLELAGLAWQLWNR